MKLKIIHSDRFNNLIPTNILQKISGERLGIIRGFYQILNEKDDPEFFNLTTTHTNLERILGVDFKITFRAGGTGLSLKEAFMRAIGEIMERYSISFYDKENLIFATFNELKKRGIDAINPNNLSIFSDWQYHRYDFPFEKFKENTKVRWIEGINLTNKSHVLIPAQLVIGAYKFLENEKRIGYSTTSGCAAASTIEEGILKGVYEQIERDAAMITWFTKYSPPKVELNEALLVNDFYGKIKNGKIRYYILDIHLDHKIPVIMCFSVDNTERNITSTFGFSSNLDIEEAVYKALLEVSQGRVYIKRSVATIPYSTINPFKITDFDGNLRFYANRINLKYLNFLLESPITLTLKELKNRFNIKPAHDIKKDLKTVLRLLFKKKYNVIVFDLTTNDIRELGFNVVRVFIPELVQLGVPAYPFLGNKRLYELPKKLGYRSYNLKENELNKMPHPIP